jgi:nucleotide-binding universal stress UspA family protein
MFKRILLCYDGSKDGRGALRQGAELAIHLGAEAFVLSIVPSSVTDGVALARCTGHGCAVDVDHEFRTILEESVAWLKARGVTAESLLAHGNVIDVIIDQSKRFRADLIVVGQYPKVGGGRWWSNTPRATLSERAPCSVFISVS